MKSLIQEILLTPTCPKKKVCKRDWGGAGEADEVGGKPGQQTEHTHLFWTVGLTKGDKDGENR